METLGITGQLVVWLLSSRQPILFFPLPQGAKDGVCGLKGGA